MAAGIRKYKLVLVGDGDVGKTTFARKLRTGEFEPKYVATIGVEVHPVKFETSEGPIVFYIWDTAGQDKFGGMREGYYLGSDACIVMHDLSESSTFNHIPKWVNDVHNTCGDDIPIVVIGNKIDRDGAVLQQFSGFSNFHISTKEEQGFGFPFLHLARILTGIPSLQFV
jgi:GTP-binding nuclear protein Ran